MRYDVYRNLHNGSYSLRAAEGPLKGRVVGYAGLVLLTDVRYKVSEAGRQRVLREKRKNVHAVVNGTLIGVINGRLRLDDETLKHLLDKQADMADIYALMICMCPTSVYYNPYKTETFVNRECNSRVDTATMAVLFTDGHIARGVQACS